MWLTYDTPVPRLRKNIEKDAGIIDAVTFAQTRLGLSPDAKQMEVLQSDAKRGILNCSRQWGKSTVTAAKAVHRAYTRAGSTVLVASPSERQSAEFLRKAKAMVRKLRIRPRGMGITRCHCCFRMGRGLSGCRGRMRQAGDFRRR